MSCDKDYKRFCLRCVWNDSDYGCISPAHERIWQCPMYRHYHPEEVKQFDEEMKKWSEAKYGKLKEDWK